MRCILLLLSLILYLHLISGFRDFLKLRSIVKTNQQKCCCVKSMDQHLKVLLLVEPSPFSYVSGYANRFKETLKWMQSFCCNAQIVTTDNDANAPSEFISFPIINLKGFSLPMYKAVAISCDPSLMIPKHIIQFDPHLIHVSSPSMVCILAAFWARMLDVPLLISYHTDIESYARSYFSWNWISKVIIFLLRLIHNQADLVLCTSPQLKQRMIGYGITSADVWRKGVDTNVFSPIFKDDSMRMKLSDGDVNSPLLIYVGRLGLEKKLTRLRTVLNQIPNARLAIVGKGPEENNLKEYYKDSRVYFAGELKGDSLSKAFSSSDIFVMPSDTETLGLSVMESLASGIPAVGVQAGGLLDIIQNNHTGFLVDNNEDMNEFTACVKTLIDNPSLRKQFGKNGNEWAVTWGWENATNELITSHYKNAIYAHKLHHTKNSNVEEFENIFNQVFYYDDSYMM